MTAWATTAAWALYGAGGAALAASAIKLRQRLQLSKAKHRSLAGHARMSRRLAALLPYYEYDAEQFFCVDDAPPDVAARRRAGLERLSALHKARHPQTIARTAAAATCISDLQFTDAY